MNIEDIRARQWDFGLTIITVILLGGLGVQSFVGTLYVWWAQRSDPAWMDTGYGGYVETMNLIAAPMLLALVVAMGLCVPKRLFSRRMLVSVSTGMVIFGVGAGWVSGSLASGLAVYLSLAALIQVAVVVMTAAGVRGPSYLTQGRLTKLGSGLLHLGFILFALVIAALQNSPFMLPVFWTSAVLVTAGTALSFWADRVAFHRHPLHDLERPDLEDESSDSPDQA